MTIFSIATLLACNTTISPKLGDGDASKKTGLSFEEHDLSRPWENGWLVLTLVVSHDFYTPQNNVERVYKSRESAC